MSLIKNPFTSSANTLLVTNLGGATVSDMINVFNAILDDNIPDGKTRDDFTGGYIQQMANSNQLVLYFGYKTNGDIVTKNRDTVIIAVDDLDLDSFYIGLKAKIVEMRFKGRKTKHKKVSFSDVFSTMLDAPTHVPNKVCYESVIIPEQQLFQIADNSKNESYLNHYKEDIFCDECGLKTHQCVC